MRPMKKIKLGFPSFCSPMDDQSANEETLPLIKIKAPDHSLKFKKHFLATPMKFILKFSMWVIFISWVSLIFIYPSQFFNHWYRSSIRASMGTMYGASGINFLLFSAPILVIAFLATAYLTLSGEEEIQEKKASKKPRFRLWTFPIIVDGPLGVVSAAELIGIVLFCVFIMWSIYAYALRNLSRSGFQLPHKQEWYLVLEQSGGPLGLIGLFCLVFLFLPVARGSMLLQLIDIPFEHATRYHIWLGHLTMLIFTLHGLSFVMSWAMQGRLFEELLQLKNARVANLAGLISLIAGLLIWVTSRKPVRRERFELFFYTHQLYAVFVVFMALHVGDFFLCYAAGGIFLFILDRLLRFCQSRRVVNVVSAACLPCGTVELVVSKPKNLKYNALSFIFLQVRELAFLQWHPFSVSSSPLEGNHIAVLIKGIGGWTKKLRERISNGHDDQSQVEQPLTSHPNMTVSVEGPYGHESPYHLAYEYLILVAGGIGIAPFLAILSDILHRVKDGKPCLPKNILILWAVKKSDELPLLYGFDMESVCPFYSDKLNVEIQTFVTRESEPQLMQEEGKITMRVNSIHNRSGVSVLVGTGHVVWSGMYVMVSTIGLILSVGLLNVYYINPYRVTHWWYKGLLLITCMVLSPLIFGGAVIGLWHFWEKMSLKEDGCEGFGPNIEIRNANARREDEEVSMGRVADTKLILYGCRPDFEAIFGSMGEKWGHVDIGVIVCGPPTLQKSVAKECRSQNLRKRKGDFPIFHFYSHSFEL